MLRLVILLLCVSSGFTLNAATNLTSLNTNGIDSWQTKAFSGETIYSTAEYKSRLALKALSNASASGLVLKQKLDLTKTPYINWSWLVEKKLSQLDEHTKSGDDFAARIYVGIDGGFRIWKTKSVGYVWSSNQDKGVVWNNAFAGSSFKMFSIQGKNSETGKWYDEKRNVYQDLITAFGDKGSDELNQKAYRYIDVIALMTDTDNSGKTAESYYGDIIFSAD